MAAISLFQDTNMSDLTSCENALQVIFKFSARPWNTLRSSFVGGGGVNSCASTTSWQTLLLEESNFLENVEKQMRKSRFKSPVVSNGRGQFGKSGGQLTCAMQDTLDTLCSTIPHLFLYQAHFFNPPPSLVPRSRSVLSRGRSGYKITYPLLTQSLNYL